MLKCVKTGSGYYVAPDEMNIGETAYIYVPDGQADGLPGVGAVEILSDESVFFSKRHERFSDIIKGAFNPLQKTQNALFITKSGDIAFEVPRLYARSAKNEQKILGLINAAPDAALMENLLSYAITKDLFFMNKLTARSFDPSAFKLCEKFLEDPENHAAAEALLSCVSRKSYQNDVLLRHEREEELRKAQICKAVGGGQSKKNVVLIHLESISQLIFNSNRYLMPNIAEIFGKSVNFSRYYSPATSTLMTVSAIFHGNDFELDGFASYEEIMLNEPISDNIFKILRENGYETKPFIYTNPALSKEFYEAKIYDDGVSGDGRVLVYEKFLSETDKFFESNKKGSFAAFIDYEPTHCGVNDEETAKIPVFEQKSKYAYLALDNVVGHVWASLREKDLLEKTIIVLYGDHGDDKWTRCINNGFSHMTEPYLSSIHTPFAIYDSRLDYALLNGIVNGIDIKPTVLYMLGIDNPDTFPYSGINVFERVNDCAYSASLFANQSENEKIGSFEMAKLNGFCSVETKNKSFCVIDDNFCLVGGKDGLQLFSTASDPLSYNNLLNFYEFDENGLAVKFKNYGSWRGHFRIEIMADAQVYECLRGFYGLREKLMDRISAKNGYVHQLKNPFDFSVLTKVRDRGFIFE